MHEYNEYRLIPQPDSPQGPVWANSRNLALVGMLRIDHPDSDFSEENPLPYGHTAFLDEGTELWVCRAWLEGAPVAYLTIQTFPDWETFTAVHDWRFDTEVDGQLLSVLLALIASAPEGIKTIAAPEARQDEIHRLIGPVLFDMHGNARLQWSDYERYSQRTSNPTQR